MPDNDNKSYDSEPVAYCARCYSLKIMHEDAVDADCCMECGSTEISTTSIGNWERLYEERYGHKFVGESSNPRNSIYFKMPVSELKTRVYMDGRWRSMAKRLYPGFPNGLGRADSIILLFDKLSKDGRMDDLRYMLYNYSKEDNKH
jgi:hypothetical protein